MILPWCALIKAARVPWVPAQQSLNAWVPQGHPTGDGTPDPANLPALPELYACLQDYLLNNKSFIITLGALLLHSRLPLGVPAIC